MSGDSRRIVVAPDSFKGSLEANAVAASITAGWSSVRPGDTVLQFPMADGGEGTLDAYEAAIPGAERIPVVAPGPDGRMHTGSWVLLPDGTGVVELAETSGITLMDRLDAEGAHTLGFGAAIAAALDHGAQRLILAIGGSASTDGGAGVLSSLGARFLGADGTEVAGGNAGLDAIRSVDLSGLRPPPAGGAIVLSDVRSPLLGSDGAAAIFGPQKGADPAVVQRMEARLAVFATLLPADPETPGAGAAGGTGFGLVAWGATLAPGALEVARTIGLDAAIADADLVITGEGGYDGQSSEGKVAGVVAGLCHAASTEVALVAGRIDADPTGFRAAVSLTDLAGSGAAAMADAAGWLRVAGATLPGRIF